MKNLFKFKKKEEKNKKHFTFDDDRNISNSCKKECDLHNMRSAKKTTSGVGEQKRQRRKRKKKKMK